MKKNVAVATFYCLVSTIWEKNSIFCCYKKGNNAWFVLFYKRKNQHNICRFLIKYIYFFQRVVTIGFNSNNNSKIIAKLFAKNFSKNSNLDDSGVSLLALPSRSQRHLVLMLLLGWF